MLQPLQNLSNAQKLPPTPAPYTPAKNLGAPMEQATIGRSLVIKGEITGSESLYIDGRIEGTVNLGDGRVTIGRNGSVTANITAREVVIMGSVKGNVQCTDRVDVRSEGSLIGDVNTQRISVEDGAVMKGSVEVRASGMKHDKSETHALAKTNELAKSATAGV